MSNRLRWSAVLMCASMLYGCRTDLSTNQPQRAGVTNPPEARIERGAPASEPASRGARLDDPTRGPVGREAILTLDVKFAESKIGNPSAERGFDVVRLRSYQTRNSS